MDNLKVNHIDFRRKFQPYHTISVTYNIRTREHIISFDSFILLKIVI